MSEKKKHHSFRVKLPALEVMQRLQSYASMSDSHTVDIHTINVNGYDFTFRKRLSQVRVSFREDDRTRDTVVFVEHTGTAHNEDLATEIETILTASLQQKALFRPARFYGNNLELIISMPQNTVVEFLKNVAHPTGSLIFEESETGYVLHFYNYPFKHAEMPSSSVKADAAFYVYIRPGYVSGQTHISFVNTSMGIGCQLSLAIFTFFIAAIVGSAKTLPFFIVMLGIYVAGLIFDTLSRRRKQRAFIKWLSETLQSIAEQTAHEAKTTEDTMQDDNTPREMKQSHE